MADALIVRRGGGSSISFSGKYAIIGVEYPAGSICTCSMGSTTLRAKDTKGMVAFNIPSSGTWTVSCTGGAKTMTTSVSITREGQVEKVNLAYALTLISNGERNGEYTATGFTQTLKQNIRDGDTDKIFTCQKVADSSGGSGPVFSPQIDLTSFSTLTLKVFYDDGYGNDSSAYMGFFTAPPTWTGSSVANVANVVRFGLQNGSYVGVTGMDVTAELTVDVSSLSGNHYFGCFCNGCSAYCISAVLS